MISIRSNLKVLNFRSIQCNCCLTAWKDCKINKLANVNAHLSLLIRIKKKPLPISSCSASQHPNYLTLMWYWLIFASLETAKDWAESSWGSGWTWASWRSSSKYAKGSSAPFTSLDHLEGCCPLPVPPELPSPLTPNYTSPFLLPPLLCCCHQIQVCPNAEKACDGFFSCTHEVRAPQEHLQFRNAAVYLVSLNLCCSTGYVGHSTVKWFMAFLGS